MSSIIKLDAETFHGLITRVEQIEKRFRKIDRDEELIKRGFTIDCYPPLGKMLLAKYLSDKDVLTEQFFESYQPLKEYSYGRMYNKDTYAWREIECKAALNAKEKLKIKA